MKRPRPVLLPSRYPATETCLGTRALPRNPARQTELEVRVAMCGEIEKIIRRAEQLSSGKVSVKLRVW